MADRLFHEILLLPHGIRDNKYLDGHFILEASDTGILEKNFSQRLNPTYLRYFIGRCRRESDNLLLTARHIREQAPYDSLNDAELCLLYTDFFSRSIRVFIFLPTIVVLERVLEKALRERLHKHLEALGKSTNELDRYMKSLVFPSEKTIPSRAIIDLYRLGAAVSDSRSLRDAFQRSDSSDILQEVRSNTSFLEQFNHYIDNYDFMDVEDYVGDPLSPEELCERIKDVIENAQHRLARVREEEEKKKLVFQESVDHLQLPPDLLTLVHCVQGVHYQRQHRSDAIHKGWRDVMDLMNSIAKRFGIDYKTFITLTHSEIIDSFMAAKLVVDTETIQSRCDGYGIRRIDGEWEVITGEQLATELAALPAKKPRDREKPIDIRGDVAYHGTHRGRVAVVTRKTQIDKVRRGDVLVSHMTNSHYVPAMILAGAIVTDEGGILSHASIVARELGVPCIVGTEVATDLLKDGDIVEIVATGESGQVRIVKRSK